MAEVDKHANKNISRMIVGNKKDLEDQRKVPYNEGKELADHFTVQFFETSAKNLLDLEEAFLEMAREMRTQVIQNKL